MKNEYRIPEENIKLLTKKITSINNKAKKLGCGSITLQTIGKDYVALKDGNIISEEEIIANKLAGINTEFYKRIIIEIEGTAPHLNGWEFMATLEHLENGQNIIRKATNEEIPSEYRTAEVKCDHCGIKRARKNTYLIRNTETGEYKQVGSGCLLDFFNGRDPHNTAKYAELLTTLDGTISGFYGMTKPAAYIETKHYLNYVEECIKSFGWIGRSTAKFNQTATADEAYNMMFGKCSTVPNNEAKVEDALNWLATQTPSSDYMYNLKTACSNEYIHHKLIGIVAALMITYQKHLNKQRPVLDTSKSNFIGNINDKIEITATVKRCVSFESNWGFGYFNTFVDDNGNVIVWKTSSGLEEGKTYNIKGTVKSHDTYKEEKQTYLTRCKLVELVK